MIKHVSHVSGGGEGCAIQCAVAANMLDTNDMDWMNMQPANCPECKKFHSVVGGVIVHLNDDHKWNLDCIAQWVASVEPLESESNALAAKQESGELVAKQ